MQVNKRDGMASLSAIAMGIKRYIPVVAGSSTKSIQPLALTVANDKDVLNTEPPLAYVEFRKDGRTEVVTLFDAMKFVGLYEMGSWKLMNMDEMTIGDNLLRNDNIVHVDFRTVCM